MSDRPRQGVTTVFCAYIAFVVAGLGFQKVTEYDDFVDAARAHALIGGAFTAVQVGAAVALLAVLAGGLPIAYAALRYALRARRRDILVLFAVPVAAVAVLIVGGRALLHIASGQPPRAADAPPTALDVASFLGLIGLLILLAIASTVAVATAVARSEIDAGLLRYALWPAGLTTAAMAVMFAAVVVWGLDLRAAAPRLFDGNDGIVATSTALSWLAQVVVMGAATAVATSGLFRGLAAGGTPRE